MHPRHHIPRKCRLFTLMIFIMGCVGLRAELKWDKEKVELTPLPADASVDA